MFYLSRVTPQCSPRTPANTKDKYISIVTPRHEHLTVDKVYDDPRHRRAGV